MATVCKTKTGVKESECAAFKSSTSHADQNRTGLYQTWLDRCRLEVNANPMANDLTKIRHSLLEVVVPAHRVAISNRLIAADGNSVTFKVKDYRIEAPAGTA